MNVKVLGVEDKSFEKDGKSVPGVSLAYEAGGKRETRISWIPTVAPVVLAWKPDEEHDIEPYTDKKDRAAFKLPGQGGGGGGFGKGLSYDERAKLDDASSEAMDRRTSLMQAVAFHNSSGSSDGTVIQTAGKYLEWLRAQRSVGAGSARGRADSAPTSSPVQGRGTTAAGEGAYNEDVSGTRRAEVPGDRADSGEDIPSAPAAVTTPAGGPPTPPAGTPASPGDGQRGATVIPPSPGTTSALLAEAVTLYGTKAKVLSAARMLHDWKRIEEVDDTDLRLLIEKRKASV